MYKYNVVWMKHDKDEVEDAAEMSKSCSGHVVGIDKRINEDSVAAATVLDVFEQAQLGGCFEAAVSGAVDHGLMNLVQGAREGFPVALPFAQCLQAQVGLWQNS